GEMSPCRARGASFETPPSAAPQDEARWCVACSQTPHAEEAAPISGLSEIGSIDCASRQQPTCVRPSRSTQRFNPIPVAGPCAMARHTTPDAASLRADKAAALRLVPVSRETEQRLDQFVALLQTWQSRINLVAPSTMGHVWTRHVADSLQI